MTFPTINTLFMTSVVCLASVYPLSPASIFELWCNWYALKRFTMACPLLKIECIAFIICLRRRTHSKENRNILFYAEKSFAVCISWKIKCVTRFGFHEKKYFSHLQMEFWFFFFCEQTVSTSFFEKFLKNEK